MRLSKTLLKTSPVGYAAIKAAEHKNDAHVQEAKEAKAAQKAAQKAARDAQKPEAIHGRMVAKYAPGMIPIKLYADGYIAWSWGNVTGSIIGATARVDQSGSERIFRDTRQAYLMIEGPEVSIAAKLTSEGRMNVGLARQFAAKVNQLSQQLTPAAQSVTAAPAASKFDQLEQLGKLRDSGVLTEEEFQAQKASLLQ